MKRTEIPPIPGLASLLEESGFNKRTAATIVRLYNHLQMSGFCKASDVPVANRLTVVGKNTPRQWLERLGETTSNGVVVVPMPSEAGAFLRKHPRPGHCMTVELSRALILLFNDGHKGRHYNFIPLY